VCCRDVLVDEDRDSQSHVSVVAHDDLLLDRVRASTDRRYVFDARGV
jgi:hypothetical protein